MREYIYSLEEISEVITYRSLKSGRNRKILIS